LCNQVFILLVQHILNQVYKPSVHVVGSTHPKPSV
jgi:hypothetical protein